MKKQKTFEAALREDVIPELHTRHQYFSINAVRAELARQRIRFDRNTLKQYMARLQKDGSIHDAGRGWYTFIKEPFQLDPEPTSELVQLLERKYPLLDCACWSTAQVKHYTHQTLAKFISFVYVEKHNRSAVFETLRDAGFNAYLDPSKAEAERTFSIRDKTVVVRPSIAGQPVKGKSATIEKILVDLYAECGALPMMDIAEYRRMFSNLVSKRRIMVSAMAMYAERRKTCMSDLFKKGEYTISAY